MEYSITKTSKTEGSIKIKFNNIDSAVLEKYESDVADIKDEPQYVVYENKIKAIAYVNTDSIILNSNPAIEYTVE